MTQQVDTNQLLAMLAELLAVDPKQLTEDASFADLGADSLDLVELSMTIEELYDVVIPQEDYPKLTSLRKAKEYVEALVAQNAAKCPAADT